MRKPKKRNNQIKGKQNYDWKGGIPYLLLAFAFPVLISLNVASSATSRSQFVVRFGLALLPWIFVAFALVFIAPGKLKRKSKSDLTKKKN